MNRPCAALVVALGLTAPSFALPAPIAQQESSAKVAGVDVPAPKPTKTVMPEYPPEALAKGMGGIVIVEIVVDEKGHVASAELVRSIPGLDEAALQAIRKWQYEITRVDGKPVRVRLTVPMTFARRVPEVTRQEGIPELRQGATPVYPRAATGRNVETAVVEVTLDTGGLVAEAKRVSGDDLFSEVLLDAVRTWRFAPEAEHVTVSFRVQADFVPENKGGPRVVLRLNGLRKSETLSAAAAPSAPQPSAGDASAAPSAPAEGVQAAPATDVLTAPQPVETPAPPPRLPGVSAVTGVTLEVGVPDLASGRRPVVPPLARMAGGKDGTVEVRFSVDAAGVAFVDAVDGEELLRPAAEQTVRSWTFRRTSPERLRLVAVLTYSGITASATVRPRE